MADEKTLQKENTCGVRGEEGRFFCTDCGAGLVIDHDCPECKKHIDWDKAFSELLRAAVN